MVIHREGFRLAALAVTPANRRPLHNSSTALHNSSTALHNSSTAHNQVRRSPHTGRHRRASSIRA